MKHIMLAAALSLCLTPALAQKYMTRTGKITFFSTTPVENIEAFNNEAACVIDSKTGEMAFQVPIKSFKFEKQLMQEHFNENYMESDKFPKADFKGRISDLSAVDFTKDGTYNVKASGKLTIHGITRDVVVPGTITVKNGSLTAFSKFNVRPADYGIKIPAVVANKIAQTIEVTVNSIMQSRP